jgi:large subunit ribosomal protein L10
MKTKAQKQEELTKAEELLKGSKFLAFAEFSGIPAEEVRKLRRSAKDLGANILVIKKRLLSLLFKQKGIDFDLKKFKTSIGTVFSSDVEKGSGAVYKFLSNLGETKDEKAANIKKILGGYDLAKNDAMDASKVIAIGQLPPREVLLAQLAGMIAAPIRAFMYVIQERAKKVGESQN